jgi:O-antigen/teichoic acid export membrane protein
MARVAGDKNFGIYTLVFTWINLLSIPATFGLEDVLIREVPGHLVNERKRTAFKTIWWGLVMGTRISAAVALLFGLLVHFGPNEDWNKYALYFDLALIGVPCFAIMHIAQAALRGLGSVSSGQSAEKLVKPIALLILLFGFYLSGNPLDDKRLILLNAISFLLAMCFALVLLWRFVVQQKKDTQETLAENYDYRPKEWVSLSLYFSALSSLQLLLQRLDIIILGYFYGDRAEYIAHYNVALKFSEFVLIPLSLVSMVSGPMFARLYHSQDFTELNAVYRKTTRLIVLLTIVPALGFIALGYWIILFLYGGSFLPAYSPLIILCIAQLVYASFGPLGYMFMMTGQEKKLTLALLIAVTAAFVLHLVFIPLWGINGAAWAVFAGFLIFNSLLMLFRRRG